MAKYKVKNNVRLYRCRRSAESVAKYNKKNYDQITVRVPKGQRANIAAVASDLGISTNRLITIAVAHYILYIKSINDNIEKQITKKK